MCVWCDEVWSGVLCADDTCASGGMWAPSAVSTATARVSRGVDLLEKGGIGGRKKQLTPHETADTCSYNVCDIRPHTLVSLT